MGWEHPKKEYPDYRTQRMVENYQPLYNRDAQTAMDEWLKGYREWLDGEFEQTRKEHPEYQYNIDEPYREYCKWNGQPPDPDYYRPKWKDDAVMGFAIYETVSEGTPVTPTFATTDELIYHLMNYGTDWDDGKKWSREAAEGFVKSEWAPSMVAIRTAKGCKIIMPSDAEMYSEK
jgi:hypothetical protein